MEERQVQPPAPEGSPDDTGDDSMHAKTVRGSFYSVGGQIVKNLLRLAGNVILTRLLTTEDYAISTLVNTVIIGLEMVSDIGIEASIVQSDRGEDEDFLDTAYSVQLIRGVILFLLAGLLAYPSAIYFDAPGLSTLLPVAGAGALVRGFWPTRLHLLRRHLEVKMLVALEISAQAAALVFMTVHAYIFRSVWALVLGSVVTFVTPLLVSTFMPGHRNRFRWEPAAVLELVSFGKWIFLSTLITFAANNFNVFASGKLVDKDTLGVYGISNTLVALPLLVGGHATNAVLLPALSAAARANRDALASAFARAQTIILPVLAFLSLGLVLLAPTFFYLIYTEDYHRAGWMVQLSAISTWFLYLQESWSRALLAIGLSRPLMIANATKLVGTAAFALMGFHSFGFPGLLLGATLGAVGGYVAIGLALNRERIPVWGPDLKFTLLALALAGIGVVLPQQLAPYIGWDWRLVAIPTSVLVLGPVGAFAGIRLLREIRNR